MVRAAVELAPLSGILSWLRVPRLCDGQRSASAYTTNRSDACGANGSPTLSLNALSFIRINSLTRMTTPHLLAQQVGSTVGSTVGSHPGRSLSRRLARDSFWNVCGSTIPLLVGIWA